MGTDRVSRRDFLKRAGALAAATALGRRLPGAAEAWAEAPAPAAAAAAKGALRFGVQTPPQHTGYADILRVWEEADELGLDSAYVFDHLMPIFSDPDGPCFEGWTLLAALAARTRRIKVGVLVTGNTYRNPALLAKMAATVDHVSDGRLILGLGAAWFEREHQAYDFDFHTAGERARRLVEAVELMKQLFTRGKSTFAGKYYALRDAPFEPKTVQKPHPPILIGGMGPKVIQPLAARHADIWHFFVRSGEPEEARKIGEGFDAICRKVGRDPAAIEKSISLRAGDFEGGDEAARARVAKYADAGVRHFILSLSPPFDRELLRRYANEVVPAFRKG
jgi:F420-dependent oxidoreductase-like protein